MSIRPESAPNLGGSTVLMLEPQGPQLQGALRKFKTLGATVHTASSIDEARALIDRTRVDAVLADVALMDEGAQEFLERYKKLNPRGMSFLVMESGASVVSEDPSGLRLVDDYIERPIDVVSLGHVLARGTVTALAVADPLISRVRPYFQFRSESMLRALEHLPRIALSDQPVLIEGETGTGKELTSHAIHVLSPRAQGTFVAVNCGAIPEGLIEGELFGHEKGAFTGADRMRRGKFEIASGGTLLLDEIGDMPIHMQVRLLRALEEGQVYRVGAERPTPINARVIAATARDLKKAVREGLFREDLYFRLSVLKLHLPPLRERIEDIPYLALHFMERAFAEMGAPQPYPKLSSAAIGLLEEHPWRGNVRELRNVMTRVATLLPHAARQVLPMHVAPHIETVEGHLHEPVDSARNVGGGVNIPDGSTLEQAERVLIDNALKLCGGNRTRAARMLGIGIRTLRRKLNQQ